MTGTIGSGKSTVAAILKKLGAAVIDSDKTARAVLEPGQPAFADTLKAFGEDILTPEKSIDRRKLAAKVFKNPAALKQLNSIIHPRVDDVVEALFKRYQSEGKKAVFVEMAILAEPRWQDRVAATWVVKVPKETALLRLKQRGMTEEDALSRLANQPAPEKQVSQNLVILNNEGNLSLLREQVAKLWRKIDNEN